jgi:hypothetical protein
MHVPVKITNARTSLKQNAIAGVVTELGQPVSRRVRAYGRSTGVLLASTTSGNNGKYKMYLPNDIAYTIVAIDKNKQYNAVVQDNVVSK